MSIPKFAIDNPHFTIIVFIVLLAMGIYGLKKMPASEDPPINIAAATVVVFYPGASSVDLENMVAEPLEDAINELENIKKLTVEIVDGLVELMVEFEAEEDPDEKYEEVLRKLNEVRPSLPMEINSMFVLKWSTVDVAILQLALVSESASYSRLNKIAEKIKTEFERVAGVMTVKIEGCPEEIVSAEIDLEKLAQYRIPLTQVSNSIASRNANIPGGFVDLRTRRFNVRTSGDYSSLEEIRNTIIAVKSGASVYLKDVASVSFGYKDHLYKTRFNGQRCLFISVTQKEDGDIFAVTSELKTRIGKLSSSLPADVSLEIGFEQSHNVDKRLSQFLSNLLQGIALVGLMIFMVISFRTAMIVMVAIPSSFLIGIGFVDWFGYGLQQITIAGLIIALGLLVDNAIVVTENICHCLKWGSMDRREASIRGSTQIAWPVFSSTVTTVLAFLPIAMMPGMTGDFIRSLPVTVIFTLAASLLLAMTLVPFLSSRFISTASAHGPNIFQRILIDFINNWYHRILSWSVAHTRTTLACTLLIFIFSLGMFPLVGISFFPKAEKPMFFINIKLPPGSNLNTTDRTVRFVENSLDSIPEVKNYLSNVGKGNPRIYYNKGREYEKANYGEVWVQLYDVDFRKMPGIIKDLRKRFSSFPGGRIEVKELEQGPLMTAPIEIKVIGDNLGVLARIAADVEETISSTEGTININNPLRTSSTDLSIDINFEKAMMLGISSFEIDRTVRTAMAGSNVSVYRDSEGKSYDIVLSLPDHGEPGLRNFERIYLNSHSGAPISLEHLAKLKFRKGYQQISHFARERSVTLTSDVAGRNVDQVTREILKKLEEYEWPANYSYHVGGELESREESFGGMERAVLVALISIFGVLSLQFRSFIQPFIIFAAIPLAVIGSIIALLLTGNSFSFTAFLGLTSLVGIVINDSIILVEYTNVLRREGKKLSEAVVLAGKTRFMPVVMTTVTTIGGLLPLTLQGGTLWAPMGWTIIGGLLTSTALTLLVVPVLYKTLASRKQLQ